MSAGSSSLKALPLSLGESGGDAMSGGGDFRDGLTGSAIALFSRERRVRRAPDVDEVVGKSGGRSGRETVKGGRGEETR